MNFKKKIKLFGKIRCSSHLHSGCIGFRFLCLLLALTGLNSCGGGGGGESGSSLPTGIGLITSAGPILTAKAISKTQVERVIAQGVQAANQLGVDGVLAVVDRVGNVLAVYSTKGNNFPNGNITISSNRNIRESGLENVSLNNSFAPYFAITKAITGAYLSSSGNAFSTRTASLIVQENFYPRETGQPAGPLFGVQFSQLPCGDLVRDISENLTDGPKRSPLGLSADPGGFPLYDSNGVVIGGVGFMSFNGTYSLDTNPRNTDIDVEEIVAYSATHGFEAPEDIRGNRISAGGVFLTYTDTNGLPVSKTTLTTEEQQNLITVIGYKENSNTITTGTAYGKTGSGYRPALMPDDLGDYLINRSAFVLTNGEQANNRFPPINAMDNFLKKNDVRLLLEQAYEIAFRGRAQIRHPQGSAIQVSISVVDSNGNVLGIVRTPDAPIFGTDVSLQKARSAVFMSKDLQSKIDQNSILNNYKNVVNFQSVTQFNGSVAFSSRGLGNFARPFYPDGNNGAINGPFSKPLSQWSPFSTGLQLDLVEAPNFPFNPNNNPPNNNPPNNGRNITNNISLTTTRDKSCAPNDLPAQNGLQIFPGGFPIYRNNQLVGGIGVSGDGVDQDDMVAFLGIENARRAGANINHAPANLRNDNFVVNGAQIRYVNCPFKPFNDSNQTNPCEGI